MTESPLHALAMQSGEPLATFEAVMAFIDGLDAIPPDTVAASARDSAEPELVFSGFSSDTSDDDLLLVDSDELLRLLDAALPSMQMMEGRQAAHEHEHDDSSASPAATVSAQVSMAASNSPTTVVKDTTRKRNAYREKMKHELQYLRSRSAEMESQLTALRQGVVTTLSPHDRQLIEAAWKRMAAHQLESRKESEAENARLKSVLQEQTEMARCLEQSLGKRLSAFVVDDDIKPRPKRGRASKTWEDEGLADLVDDLDSSFARVHQAMSESGLSEAALDAGRTFMTKSALSDSGVVTPYTELTDTAISPFHPRLTSKAVWKSIREQYYKKRDGYSVEKTWQSGNTFAVKCQYTFKNPNDGQDAHLNCKVVLRKYTDQESRMVLVWRAHNEGDGEHAGVYADETGWTVVQPIAGATTGSISRTCIHVVHRLRATSSGLDPQGAELQQQQQQSASVLTGLVLASNEEDLLGITQAVENLLLDGGMSGVEGSDPFL